MDKQPLIALTTIGVLGYMVWHGHRQGIDCWLCPYRGLVFLGGSVAIGVFLATDLHLPE